MQLYFMSIFLSSKSSQVRSLDEKVKQSYLTKKVVESQVDLLDHLFSILLHLSQVKSLDEQRYKH